MTESELFTQLLRHGAHQPAGRLALDALIRLYIDFVFGIARRASRDDSLAKDITQAVFLILARKPPTLEHPGQLPSWLFRTTRYTAANALKIAARRSFHERNAARPEEMPMSPNPDSSFDPAVLSELDKALATLPKIQQNIILLRFFRSQEYPDIAAALNISESTARKRLSRGIERMRKVLSTTTLPALDTTALTTGLIHAAAQRATPTLSSSITASLSGNSAPAVLAISKATQIAMVLTKIKIAAAVTLSLLIITSAATAIVYLATPPVPAPVFPSPSPTRVSLHNGVTAQLLAVGEQDTGKWWLPDGEPPPPALPPHDYIREDIPNRKPDARYLYLLMVIERTRDHSNVGCYSLLSKNFQERAIAATYIKGIVYTYFVIEIAPDQTSIDYRMKIASDPAVDALILKPPQLRGIPQWDQQPAIEKILPTIGRFQISTPEQNGGDVEIRAVWPDFGDSNYSSSQSFTDTSGKSIASFNVTYSSPERVISLPKQSLTHLADVRLSVTHYDQWLVFQNISLQPNTPTQFKILSGDTATSEPPN